MKKGLVYLFMVFLSVFVLSSCSDDDVYQITETDVDGVYLGSMDVDAPMGEVQLGAQDIKQKIYIKKTGDNLVKLELKNFIFNGINIGSIQVENIDVRKNGELFDFNGKGQLTLIVGGCDVKVTGTITTDGKCHIIINVDVTSAGEGMNFVGLKVTVDFSGNKLEADKSSEALITNFNFNSDSVVNVEIDKGNIIFYILDSTTNLTFTSSIEVSAGATITPASGVAKDFSNPVKYTVVSEDGITTKEYTVSKGGKIGAYDFESWHVLKGSMYADETYELPIGSWGATNDGVTTINGMFGGTLEGMGLSKYGYAVVPSTDAKHGQKSVDIKTLNTFLFLNDMDYNAAFGGLIPYNTAGSLFLGDFKTNMNDILASTLFGVPYSGKPVTFTGWYKYSPGEVYRDDKNDTIAGKTDECDIYALLYEAEDENGNEVTLIGGSNDPNKQDLVIDNSPYIILKAQLKDRTAKTNWTYFEIPFEAMNNKIYDTTKKYKLTFVCTSSKEGASYKGAPGSILTIDDFKIVTK